MKGVKTGGLILIILLISTFSMFACSTTVYHETSPLPNTNVSVFEVNGDKYDLSYLWHMDPAKVDNSSLPITPVDRLSISGRSPKSVDIESYRLTISGLVQNTLDLTYQELMSLPSTTQTVLLICHESHVDNATWTGVTVSVLLEKAGLLEGAHEAVFIALDRYSRALPLEVMKGDGIFAAYKVNGETLPLRHGYPLRLVVKDMYGENWVKWLRQIDIR
ncbi:MAG: molybdopterin-dependent oxidoreductase [Dehalococcoidia bacterium]|nr:molybdopterin-dependent oxidoreductase [Dehalococcoidia bacterium]